MEEQSNRRTAVCFDKVIAKSKKSICYSMFGRAYWFTLDQAIEMEPNVVLVPYDVAEKKGLI